MRKVSASKHAGLKREPAASRCAPGILELRISGASEPAFTPCKCLLKSSPTRTIGSSSESRVSPKCSVFGNRLDCDLEFTLEVYSNCL